MRVCHFRLPETRYRNRPDGAVFNTKHMGFGEKRHSLSLHQTFRMNLSGSVCKDKGDVHTVKTPSRRAKIHPFCLWEQRGTRTNDSRKNIGIIPAGLKLHVRLQLGSEKPPAHTLSSQTTCWCRTEPPWTTPSLIFPLFPQPVIQWNLEIGLMVSDTANVVVKK